MGSPDPFLIHLQIIEPLIKVRVNQKRQNIIKERLSELIMNSALLNAQLKFENYVTICLW